MKKIIIIISGLIVLFITIFLLIIGGPRTDVVLGDFKISSDNEIMTLKVGVASSAGYVRKAKRSGGSMDCYLTFYSTFGINSKIGAKDTFDIKLDDNVQVIYFYAEKKRFHKVLEKNNNGEWVKITNDK